MKPWMHAKSSARKHGGRPDDYIEIHQFMDESKKFYASVGHRTLTHHTLGCFWAEKKFGYVAKNSDGKEYYPRDIAEQHCLEDTSNQILPVEAWCKEITKEDWMIKDWGTEGVLNEPFICFWDHRAAALTHHGFGLYLINLLGEDAQAAEEEIMDKFGYIPTVHDWLHSIRPKQWMGPTKRKIREMGRNLGRA